MSSAPERTPAELRRDELRAVGHLSPRQIEDKLKAEGYRRDGSLADPEPDNVTRLDAARAMLEEQEQDAPVVDPGGDPPPHDGTGQSGGPVVPLGQLPEGCPVIPLGIGPRTLYYLSSACQHVELADQHHGKNPLTHLFGGNKAYLEHGWPRWSKPDKDGKAAIIGWKVDELAADLMAACNRVGPYDPVERVRGLGAWRGDDGKLILHTGDEILVGNVIETPGMIGEHVYPRDRRGLKPDDLARDPTKGATAAETLFELLTTWNWARGEDDASFLLGWIGCALVGGALGWRPMVWITGDKGTGKSTITGEDGIIKAMLGKDLLATPNTTAAGLYQHLKYNSLPIAVDELEPSERGREKGVMELARQAASGGVMMRGGADGKGTTFRCRSTFLFSSILIPPMGGQDLSRMAVLNLGPLETKEDFKLDREEMRATAKALLGRICQLWDTWPDRLKVWRDALGDAGHDARGCDQFGSLLAMADLLRFDKPPAPDDLAEIAKRLSPSVLVETDDNISNAQRCLDFLLAQPVNVFRSGETRVVAEWLLTACSLKEDGLPADTILARTGLKIMVYGKHGKLAVLRRDSTGGNKHPIEHLALVVANRHPALGEIYDGSSWETTPDAVNSGWGQALRRLDHATSAGAQRFAGVNCKAWAIPMTLVFPDGF